MQAVDIFVWSVPSLGQGEIHYQQNSASPTDISRKLLKYNTFQFEMNILYEHLKLLNYLEIASRVRKLDFQVSAYQKSSSIQGCMSSSNGALQNYLSASLSLHKLDLPSIGYQCHFQLVKLRCKTKTISPWIFMHHM